MAAIAATYADQRLAPEPVDHRLPLLIGNPDFHVVTETVAGVVEKGMPRGWWIFFGVSLAMFLQGAAVIGYLFWKGIGIWGVQNPVGWGWAITNFVWWIGIGHAGTLISAVLFLLRQRWRTSINRFAEAMTLFAVLCALTFPSIHVGRPWFLYWFLPIPDQMKIWQNFRSPLLWDFFAVSVYGTVSFMFWYLGLIPDLATMRDRAKGRLKPIIYGIFALGWRGSMRHWVHYERAYLILAGLATPLVLSVHSIVSFDFAASIVPGWHSTIFPPYFVAGAIFSGFALVLTLMLIARQLFGLQHIVTLRHIEAMNKVMLSMGLVVAYAYGVEAFSAWYSGNLYEGFTAYNRAFGPYAWAYWTMIFCNVVMPQTLWFKRLRTSVMWTFIATIFVNIGMWFERFVIIVSSLANDYLPSSWRYYRPTVFDVAIYVGTFGLFFTLFSLFIRFVPMIAMSEIKQVLPQADPHAQPAELSGSHA